MTGAEIAERARSFSNQKYWYGAKNQLATVALANQLRVENPNVWTYNYYNKALKDVDGRTKVCDCSGLVCFAYQIGTISSYGIRDKYPKYSGDIKTGMILWRKGHVGIYDNGYVCEMKGIDYDYQHKPYNASEWTEIHYDPNVQYEQHDYDIGWHYDAPTMSSQGGWWYAYGTTKGSYYRNRVVRINGAYYAFRDDGYMVEGSAMIVTDENGEIIGVE